MKGNARTYAVAAVVAVCISVVAVAWGRPERGPGPNGLHGLADAPAGGLIGRSFTSVAIWRGGKPVEMAEGTQLEFAVENENGARHMIVWSIGCNRMAASVRVSENVLQTGRSSTTAVGCPAEVAIQEEWLQSFFDSDLRWRLGSGDRLVLESEQIKVELEER